VDITILIVNWNSGEHLRKLLASLEGAREIVSGILVVDNASSDRSFGAAEDVPWVELHRMERNSGFAAAVNRGFSLTDSRYIFLVNPDLVFEDIRKTLERLCHDARGADKAAVVTCPLYSLGEGADATQEAFQFRPFPGLAGTVADLLFLDYFLGERGEPGKISARPPGNGGVAVELQVQPAAALWLISREAWNDVGGMDEGFYPAWFEDVDFCLRARDRGWKLYLSDCASKVYHAGGSSVPALGFRRFLLVYYHNLLRYWWKHHKWSYPLALPAVGTGLAARLLLHLAGIYPRR